MSKEQPPGPRDFAFGMRTARRMKADILGTYAWLKRDYGDAVSFVTGPYRLYLFFHPDQVREVLVTQAKSLIRLPRVMQTFAQWNGSSLLIAEGEPWARQRRLVQQGFQPSRLPGYGDIIVDCASRMSASWLKLSGREGCLRVDTNAAMTQLTLLIICRTMFGVDPGGASSEIAEAFAVLSEIALHEMQAPIRIPRWLPTRRNSRKKWAINVLDSLVWKFVRERRADGRDHGDLLSMLLQAVDDESGGLQLDDRQVRDEVMTLMLAGYDTTAAAFEWLWYIMARHAQVAEKCYSEIVDAVGERPPTLSDIEKMPYLNACIKETLRLYPPAIGVFLRQAARNTQIGGYNIRKESLIMVSSFVTQRDERWFKDAERFNPERFLPPKDAELPSFAYFPFGAGPRACIGKSFAMNELALVAATLLKSWTVSMAPGQAEPALDVQLAMRPRDPLTLRWTQRDPRANAKNARLGHTVQRT